MVVIEAKHMCMMMRGIEKQNAITTTSDFSGAFNQAKTREEFIPIESVQYQVDFKKERRLLYHFGRFAKK